MQKTVCFIGHRKIGDTTELREQLVILLTELIEKGAENFIFGDHSAFNGLCYETVTELKKKFPAIKRIYYRKDYEDTDDYTLKYIKTGYEDSVCPKGIGNAGKAAYIKRNQAMINKSDICVFYYNENYLPPRRKNRRDISDYQPKSGTG